MVNWCKSFREKSHKYTFGSVDWLIKQRWLLSVMVCATVVVVVRYIFKRQSRDEDWPSYLVFGIATVLGFFVSYMVLHYVRPISGMKEYVEYLVEVLQRTMQDEELIVLASTPNPGLSDYLLASETEQPGHYYQRYKCALSAALERGARITYRILPWGERFPQSLGELDENTPLMRFCAPFIARLPIARKERYKEELLTLMGRARKALRPTSPVIKDSKGFLVIWHETRGFFGVYDATGGELRIRGIKILEPLFLTILREVCELIQPVNEKQKITFDLVRENRALIRGSIDWLWTNNRPLYKSLFLMGNSIAAGQLGEVCRRNLAKTGILKKRYVDLWASSCCSIFRLDSEYLFTDFHTSHQLDRVFPIFHENLLLAQKLKVPNGGKVLDIGFGAGIFSIVAARRGALRVYASDINPNAWAYAKFGAIINEVEEKIDFRIGGTFEPFSGLGTPAFDLICSNPPFLPIPSGMPYYIHSNGCEDGMAVIRKIVAGLEKYVRPGGLFQMVAMSLGNGVRDTLVSQLLKQTFTGKTVSVLITQLKEPLPLNRYCDNLRNRTVNAGFMQEENAKSLLSEWESNQTKNGRTHLHYIYVEVNFGQQKSFDVVDDYTGTEDLRRTIRSEYGFPDGIQWET